MLSTSIESSISIRSEKICYQSAFDVAQISSAGQNQDETHQDGFHSCRVSKHSINICLVKESSAQAKCSIMLDFTHGNLTQKSMSQGPGVQPSFFGGCQLTSHSLLQMKKKRVNVSKKWKDVQNIGSSRQIQSSSKDQFHLFFKSSHLRLKTIHKN